MLRISNRLASVCTIALFCFGCGESEVVDPPADAGLPADAEVQQDASAADAEVFEDAAEGAPDAGAEDAAAIPDSGRLDVGPRDGGEAVFTLGDPIEAPAGEWTWVDFPDTRCVNDTPTGLGINTSSTSEQLVIFLTGGNACFNVASCFVTANLDGYGAAKFANEAPGLSSLGAFDRTQPENYLADWNYVYVPYCSGDIFAGSEPNGVVGSGRYNFNGYNNITAYLQRLVPTFPNLTDVLLVGVSAGGFGAIYNYDQVARAFGPAVRVTLLDDSGPGMAEPFITGCLQSHFRTTWGLDRTLPVDCDDCFNSTSGGFVEDYTRYVVDKYADRNFALVSSSHDQTIRTFWGFGLDECSLLVPGLSLPMYPEAMFQDGLEDLRDRVFRDVDNAKLYMPISDRHVWLNSPPWTVEHHGVVLQDWMQMAIEGDPAWANAPETP